MFSYLLRLSLKKVWKFGYSVLFSKINFREFVLDKNFPGINFCEIARNWQNLRKLLPPRKLLFSRKGILNACIRVSLASRANSCGFTSHILAVQIYLPLNLVFIT